MLTIPLTTLIVREVVSILNEKVASGMFNSRIAWNEGVERRVSATSSMLHQIKSIKMMGLAEYFRLHIKELRENEIRMSKAFRLRIVWSQMLGKSCPIFNVDGPRLRVLLSDPLSPGQPTLSKLSHPS